MTVFGVCRAAKLHGFFGCVSEITTSWDEMILNSIQKMPTNFLKKLFCSLEVVLADLI